MFLIVEGTNATTAQSSCPHPKLETRSAVRKRLLVLFAGQAATQKRWPERANNSQDWHDALRALNAHFQRKINWNPAAGMSVSDTEANELVQMALARCTEIVSHASIRTNIDNIGALLAERAQGTTGRVSLSGPEIVSICEQDVGGDFQRANPWLAWIDGS